MTAEAAARKLWNLSMDLLEATDDAERLRLARAIEREAAKMRALLEAAE